jgi:hypothetical protein
MAHDGKPFEESPGNRVSEQAEATSANRGAGTLQMRILIELQVISYLLHQSQRVSEDLAEIRKSVAASIT